MRELLEKSVAKAMDYEQYVLLFQQLMEEGRTTGEATAEMVEYTKLNHNRSKRLDKTATIDDEATKFFQNISLPQTWLVISEPWCGDAAQTLPYLNKLAQLSDKVDLKIVLRDENLDLMDQFLTNGSRSIPMVIILNQDLEVLNTWGPRSKEATQLVTDYKTKNGQLDDVFKTQLQLWYNNDKGKAIVKDLTEALEQLVSL